MGTYLILELEDKSDSGIAKANAMWNYENPEGYENAVHFTTRCDQLEDVEYINLDENQEHLRGESIEELEDKFGSNFKRGVFKAKITMGDYLCSAMASRILTFINGHEDMLVDTLDAHTMEILEKTRRQGHRAEHCFADCPYCRGEA